jgi:hypothetical protein
MYKYRLLDIIATASMYLLTEEMEILSHSLYNEAYMMVVFERAMA